MSNEDVKVVAEATERPYTLRRLKDADLWPVLGIISAVFPEDVANNLLDVVSGEKQIREMGVSVFVRLIKAVLKNMTAVQDEVYAFLADVSGIPAAEIKEMEFGTTPMMIWDIVSNEKNAGFFKAASKLL